MKVKLYWVKDFYGEYGHENWFVFGKTKTQAESFYVNYEGMDWGEAEAELVDKSELCHTIGIKAYNESVEKRNKEFMPVHAHTCHLKELGFEIIFDGDMRKVCRNGKSYQEGGMEALVNMAREKINNKLLVN